MKKILSLASTALLFAAICPLPLNAAIIPNVNVIEFSSQYASSGGDSRAASNLVTTCGLFGSSHTWSPAGSTWLANGTTPSSEYVVFDLGTNYNLSAIKIYNYDDESTTSATNVFNGVQNADFLFGTVQDTYISTYPNVTLAHAPVALNNLGDFSTNLMLTNLMTRYVEIKVNSSWGNASNHVGLSKVQFLDPSVKAVATFATVNWLSNSITIGFSEGVTVASATNAANYVVTNSAGSVIPVTSAAMGPFNDSVVLQTPGLTGGPYGVAINNVAVVSDGTFVSNTLSVVSQLAFWLKGDVGVVTNTTGVTTWSDQSGNGNNAQFTGSPIQPTLTPNDINGLPSVAFGATGYLDVPYSPTIGGSRDTAIFALVKVANNAANNEIVSRAAVNRAAPFDFRYQSSKVPIMYRGNDFGSGSFSSQSGTVNIASNNVYAYVGVNLRGTNCVQYINGPINGAAGVLLLGVRDSQLVTRIGGRVDNAVHLSGSIAEILMFRGGIGDADRVAINHYISAKYGVSITDLSITAQPTATNVLEGQTASFGVTVLSSSTTATTYQWRTNGVSIPGATSSTYTTPLLPLSADQEMFSVVATSLGNSVTSAPVTLSVGVDTIAPTVAYAGIPLWNSNQIEVVFSKTVSAPTATTIANYTLDSGTVTSATFGSSPNKIVLGVSGLTSVTPQLTVQNVQDLFNNTLVTTQVNVGLYPQAALWLRADAGITTDGSMNVTEWDDQSGNGNAAVPIGSSAPLFEPSIFNGKPAVYFDGSSTYLAVLTPSANLYITGDMGIYSVIRFTDYTPASGDEVCGITGGGANNIPNPFDYYAATGDGRMHFYRGNGGTGGSGVSYNSVFSTAGPSAGVLHAISVTQGGTAVVHYLDGAKNGTGSLNQNITANTTLPLGIGTRTDLLTKMHGEIAELLIFSTALDSGDQVALDGLMGKKYAIAITVAQPKLSVTPMTGNQLQISWTTPAVNFGLQATPSLTAPAAWSPVTNAVTINGSISSVTVSETGTAQFYRLQQQ